MSIQQMKVIIHLRPGSAPSVTFAALAKNTNATYATTKKINSADLVDFVKKSADDADKQFQRHQAMEEQEAAMMDKSDLVE